MKFVTINDLKTAYYDGGIGQRQVLFLHGWASSGKMWLRMMWAMRHQYSTWAIDLPGCGDSDSPSLDWYSIERYTDHVAAFCVALGIRPYAVIGHSMGGRIGFDLARRYPHLAERLVGVSPALSGKLGFNLDLFLMGGLFGQAANWSRRVWPLATASAMSLYWAPKYLGSEAVERTTNDLRRTSWDSAVGSLRALVGQDYIQHLDRVTQPTLLICGGKDFTVPPADSHLAAQKLPQARLMVLENVHHQPTDEASGIVIQALHEFLSNGASAASS